MTTHKLTPIVAALLVGLAAAGTSSLASAQTYMYKAFAQGLKPHDPSAEAPGEGDESSPWAAVSLSASVLNFGSTGIGMSPEPQAVAVLNNDAEGRAVRIESISTDHAEFEATHNCPIAPATLAAGTSCTVSVTYLATQEAQLGQMLTVATARNTVQVALYGEAGGSALDVLTDINGDFGELESDSTATRTMTLVNSGPAPLLVDKAEILGSDVFDFAYDGCSGTTLAGNQASSCSTHVRVSNVPADTTHTGTLQFTVGGQVVLSRNLSVTGVAPFAVNELSPAEVDSRDTDHVVTITGSRLKDATITLDGQPVTEVAVNEDGTEATFTVEALKFGKTQVRVYRPGSSLHTPTPGYITATVALSADSGSAEGGDEIVITGNGFDANTRVYFGDYPATIAAVSATEMTVITPVGPAGESVSVTLRRSAGAFNAGTDLVLDAAFEYDEADAAEGEVVTRSTSFFVEGSGTKSHIAYNPHMGNFVYGNSSLPGQVFQKAIGQPSALSGFFSKNTWGKGNIAVNPHVPVGYQLGSLDHNVSWFNVDGNAINVTATTSLKLLPGMSGRSFTFGALSADGSSIFALGTQGNNRNVVVIPLDENGAPVMDNAAVAGHHSSGFPAGGNWYTDIVNMTVGPDNSIWILYPGRSGEVPLIRHYSGPSLAGHQDFILPKTGEGAYPAAAPSANMPVGMAVDNRGYVYVALNHAVYRFNPATNEGGIYVGNPIQVGSVDGVGSEARFAGIHGISFSNGRLIVNDAGNLREILR